jgi:adenylylsulfate kinase
MTENIFHQNGLISASDRQNQAKHQSAILWFTGLSGAGKSTLAHAVEKALFEQGCRTYVLDGDNVRYGLCADLGFSPLDRQENIRRIGEMSKLFVDAGIITLTAFISPFQSDRDRVRHLMETGQFVEIYCRTSLIACEHRDVKGLYAKAKLGEIKDFTGISSPYEPPLNPELIIDTENESIELGVTTIVNYLKAHRIINN